MTKALHPDQRYLTALLNNDTVVINEIYKLCSRQVQSYICFNNGTAADAADIFQESLIDIYHQAKNKDLQLSCPFNAFLFMVCKRKWMNELKKRSLIPVTNMEEDVFTVGDDAFALAEDLEKQKEQSELFYTAFEKLGQRCKEVIRWSMQGEAQEKIAEQMGVTYGYLRKKKSECMASLIKLVQS
ncbi:sigma-70 family RNA polymerase sigma factor [Pedobacter sp. MC2016-14]|uniref:RNA polymerase sigma factor n=1 Tax=Pedobacter sp. MC2016-14 TaxID=2897327 RepID=UPI001E5784E8|nr:sigma-70 family RNA polymerase sigma factor [Pedobacter sp. MC2016-14]MCD0488150.1 sigma-70 family RNA polymerase sigma factor [Pedobacter sp. MC2016-14]